MLSSRPVLVVCLSLCVLPTLRAQAPTAFEVAAIRPHKTGGTTSDRKFLPGGRFSASNTSLRTLIRIAFGVDDRQISGVPTWADYESYDIEAKTGSPEVLRNEDFQRLILSLLETRCNLRYHRETRESSVLLLTLATGGSKMKAHASAADSSMSSDATGGKLVLRADGISMRDLALALTRQAGRPVEDRTGLAGEFDLKLE